MKILSLFDWIACWYEALLGAWIHIDKYYASEIDKYAIQVATKNHPDIIEVWDVTQLKGEDFKDIDLIIGGSPCQWFSMAGKMLNFNDPRSKLFFEFVRLVGEIKPKYFLLENVKMKKEFQEVITEYLWVEPIEINSALVSAQNRKRLYWTNIEWIKQPEDKGILLKDILESEVDEKYNLTSKQADIIYNFKQIDLPCATQIGNSKNFWNSYESQKAYTLRACNPNWVILDAKKKPLVSMIDGELRIRQATKQWYIVANEWDGISLAYPNSTTRRGRVQRWKSNTLVCWWDSYVWDKVIRKLTPVECERLQTLPDNYTEWASDSQRYKMLWNWWTVDVIAHIFSFIPKQNG